MKFLLSFNSSLGLFLTPADVPRMSEFRLYFYAFDVSIERDLLRSLEGVSAFALIWVWRWAEFRASVHIHIHLIL